MIRRYRTPFRGAIAPALSTREPVSRAPPVGARPRRRRRHRRAPLGPRPRLRCPEEANLRAPEAVIGVHAGFIRAGAELIEANTFGANRRKLSAHLLDDELEEIVERGVKLAREAREICGQPVFVAGAIGPLGDLEGTTEPRTRYEVFLEQARLLEGRGVDLFMVETFFDLEELETAVAAVQERLVAARSSPSSPSTRTRETLAGVPAREAVARLSDAGRRRGRRELRRSARRRRSPRSGRWRRPRTGSRSPPSRTSASRAARAAGSSTRTRRPTTSPSSPRRRAASARGSSAAAAARPRRRSPRSARRSRSAASRASPLEVLERRA